MLNRAAAFDEPAVSIRRSDYTYPRGGPERTGFYPKVQITDKPETIWSDSMGRHVSTPVFAGHGCLILADRDSHLVAVSIQDGTQLWAITEKGMDVISPSVVDGEFFYYGSNQGITARAVADGSKIWQVKINAVTIARSPLLINNLLILGTGDGMVRAFDAKTGATKWETEIVSDAPPDPPGFAAAEARFGDDKARPNSASSDGKLVFVSIFDQGRVLALDLRTGEKRWSYAAKGYISCVATVGDGRVFVSSRDQKVHAVDAEKGTFLWSFPLKAFGDGDLGYAEGSVYACPSDGSCYKLDAKTGVKQWEYETERDLDNQPCILSGAPLIDATAVYFGSYGGDLYALNRKDGTLRWRHKPELGNESVLAPVTDGRRLYVPVMPGMGPREPGVEQGIAGVVAVGAP